MVRSDHVFHDPLVFQQAHPRGQPFLLGRAFVGIVGRSRSHQDARVLGHVHPCVDRLRADLVAIKGAQKAGGNLAHAAVAI